MEEKRQLFKYNRLAVVVVFASPYSFSCVSVKIPFRVAEGKVVAHVGIDQVRFEREGLVYDFVTPPSEKESRTFILYNEHTRRSNVIFNLVVPEDSDFFDSRKVKVFSNFTMGELPRITVSILNAESAH